MKLESLVIADQNAAVNTFQVLAYIKRLRSEGRSVVMVCHDLP